MKYNYSGELKSVFKALSEVRKARGYANLADDAFDTTLVPVLRKSYLVALKCDLIMLHNVLDKWIFAGAPMEIEGEVSDENN